MRHFYFSLHRFVNLRLDFTEGDLVVAHKLILDDFKVKTALSGAIRILKLYGLADNPRALEDVKPNVQDIDIVPDVPAGPPAPAAATVVRKKVDKRKRTDVSTVGHGNVSEGTDIQIIASGVEVATQTWLSVEDEIRDENMKRTREKFMSSMIKEEDVDADMEW